VTGTLVLIATPIGNLGDLSPRAVEELGGAALVCCEDTRRTGRLLAHAGIADARLRRVDDHTEARAAAEVVDLLAGGARVALVSDAGTPGISDPGARLVDAVLDAGHEVSIVPGPVAAVAALVASGLPTDRFVFEGFLPRKGRQRGLRLEAIASERRTVVLYESPNRVAATLGALAGVCGPDRRAVVARELTKLHEEFVRGSLGELAEWAEVTPKGEIVIVVEGAPEPDEASDGDIIAALTVELDAGSSARDAADSVAAGLGVGRRRAYQLTLGIPGGVTPPS
jgi:16S rRNA (cytidine1402-2'-O)-methyltransferase